MTGFSITSTPPGENSNGLLLKILTYGPTEIQDERMS
jgi:hypothetical protein